MENEQHSEMELPVEVKFPHEIEFTKEQCANLRQHLTVCVSSSLKRIDYDLQHKSVVITVKNTCPTA